jgi:hypothetical protein
MPLDIATVQLNQQFDVRLLRLRYVSARIRRSQPKTDKSPSGRFLFPLSFAPNRTTTGAHGRAAEMPLYRVIRTR